MNDGDVLRFVITEHLRNQRVDRAATELLGEVTRATIQRWIAGGRVTVDGRVCRAKDRLPLGAVLVVRPDLPPPTSALPDPSIALDVVYEDESLVVVNKPAGLVVHPGRGHSGGTLVNALLARPGFERVPHDPADPQGQLRPGIVHRIDKDTSGLLVVAKNERSREGLKQQLSQHTVTRVYRALSIGVPTVGSIRTSYGRDPRSRLKFSSQVRDGKKAVTHVTVLERLASGRAAVLECRLETGRTHQIRVHLSVEAKTPLMADKLYGGMCGAAPILAIAQTLGRQALHAAVLGFDHPEARRPVLFEVPVPSDMELALASLRSL